MPCHDFTLALRDLCVSVDGNELLHHIHMTIPVGEVHALIGPNGSGKTTLLMTLMGYPQYRVTQGQILFAGADITALGITERARLGMRIALQRAPTIAGVKLQHVVDYLVATHQSLPQTLATLVESFRLQPFLQRDINAALSGGEIKRSELFQLLLAQPAFAMLDEPDSGIDLETLPLVGEMVNTLLTRPAGSAINRNAALIITHTGYILDYVAVNTAHLMLDGRIACAGTSQLMLEEIRRHGYEGCVYRLQAQEATHENHFNSASG